MDSFIGYNVEHERKKNIIGNILSAARKKKGLKQTDVTNMLSQCGSDITQAGYSAWEKGISVPNPYQLTALCLILDIKPMEDLVDAGLVTPARLNPEGMRRLKEYEDFLVSTGRYDLRLRVGNHTPRKMLTVRTAESSVAAGYGSFLEDDTFHDESFPASMVPEDTDFAVKIAGDSMKPYYHDGQHVFVKRTEELYSGQVGIFVYEDAGYVKEYHQDEDGVRLVSYNEAYDDIEIKDFDQFHIVGQVLN